MERPGGSSNFNAINNNPTQSVKFGNMQLFLGMQIEALDANKCWCQGKIIGINESNHKVLVRFDGLSQGSDKWYDVLDSSIRQASEEARPVIVDLHQNVVSSNAQDVGSYMNAIPVGVTSSTASFSESLVPGQQSLINYVAQAIVLGIPCLAEQDFANILQSLANVNTQLPLNSTETKQAGASEQEKPVPQAKDPAPVTQPQPVTAKKRPAKKGRPKKKAKSRSASGTFQEKDTTSFQLDVQALQQYPEIFPSKAETISNENVENACTNDPSAPNTLPEPLRPRVPKRRSFDPYRKLEQTHRSPFLCTISGKANCLAGKVFLFEGESADLPLPGLIRHFGGAYLSNLTRSADYMIVGRNPRDAKVKMAIERGLKIIQIAELFEMIKTGQPNAQDANSMPLRGRRSLLNGLQQNAATAKVNSLPSENGDNKEDTNYGSATKRKAANDNEGPATKKSDLSKEVSEKQIEVIEDDQDDAALPLSPVKTTEENAKMAPEEDPSSQDCPGKKPLTIEKGSMEGLVFVLDHLMNNFDRKKCNDIIVHCGGDVQDEIDSATTHFLMNKLINKRRALKIRAKGVTVLGKTALYKLIEEQNFKRVKRLSTECKSVPKTKEGSSEESATWSPCDSTESSDDNKANGLSSDSEASLSGRLHRASSTESIRASGSTKPKCSGFKQRLSLMGAKNCLAGFSIAVDKSLSAGNRNKCKRLTKQFGGKALDNLTKTTTHFLVSNLTNAQKIEEARAVGIQVLDKRAFISLIRSLPSKEAGAEPKRKQSTDDQIRSHENSEGPQSLASKPASPQSLGHERSPKKQPSVQQELQEFTVQQQQHSQEILLESNAQQQQHFQQNGQGSTSQKQQHLQQNGLGSISQQQQHLQQNGLGSNAQQQQHSLQNVQESNAHQQPSSQQSVQENAVEHRPFSRQSLDSELNSHHQQHSQPNLEQEWNSEQELLHQSLSQRRSMQQQQQQGVYPMQQQQLQEIGKREPMYQRQPTDQLRYGGGHRQRSRSAVAHPSTPQPKNPDFGRHGFTPSVNEDVKMFGRRSFVPPGSGRFSTGDGGSSWDSTAREVRYRECPEDCGEIIESSQMKSHLESDCRNAETECPICKFKMLRRELDGHIARNAGKHITVLGNEMTSLKHINSKLSSENRSLQQSIESLNERLVRLEEQSLMQAEEYQKLQFENRQVVEQLRSMTAMERS